jgi:hypothetical protein
LLYFLFTKKKIKNIRYYKTLQSDIDFFVSCRDSGLLTSYSGSTTSGSTTSGSTTSGLGTNSNFPQILTLKGATVGF